MSIIEKAVNTLSKSAGPEKAEDGTIDRPVEGDTVQSAVSNMDTDKGPVAAEPQEGQPTVSATSAPAAGAGKLVELPFDELRQKGMLTPMIPRSAIAEEYRTIKRPLLVNIAGDSVTQPIRYGNLIMVTSALEGDGKTFTSISLAMSIAMEKDKTVLFVDADTAKSEAGRLMGVPANSPGLIDVLEGKGIDLDDVILPTNVEKLRILPAGHIHTHANELLASEAMRRLMLELSERYPDRVIVFDSPPLLLTTEAAVLASFMGQIVFVVSADSTPQHAITQAIEHIGEDKMVGMVLNRARKHGNLYAYAYGGDVYGYGNHDQDIAPEA